MSTYEVLTLLIPFGILIATMMKK
ncbi:putative holin-like toxin [uncultured Dialister sp.]